MVIATLSLGPLQLGLGLKKTLARALCGARGLVADPLRLRCSR